MTRAPRLADSYRARLLLGYVVVAVVFAAAWLWSLYGPLTDAALRQQQRNLTAVAQSAALVAAESSDTPQAIAQQLVARTDLRLTIVAADGTVIADSENDPGAMENHRDRPEIAGALGGLVSAQRRTSATEGTEQLYVAVPGSLEGRRVALRVSQPLAEIEAVAARSRRIGLLLLFAAALIAAFVAARASAVATEPVRALSDAAERMAAGDLTAKVPEVPSELEAIAASLATMRDEVRARVEALEAEEQTLRATLDGLDDAVLLLDGHMVRFANGATDRLFRAPAGGWVDTPLLQTQLPASLVAAISERLGASRGSAVELEPDPTGRTLRLAVAPLATPGRRVVVISDTTDRSQLERVRRDFVANASHELKTPVAGIKLLAESAGTAAEDGDVEQAVAFAQQIAAEAERLRRLVADLLDLSRLETTPRPESITDVRAAIDRATTGHRSAAARGGLSLKVDLSEIAGQDVFVAADPTDLAIALDNLLDNAIAYTDAGSVTVRATATPSDVVLTVTDTGPGIEAEHLGRIFERFYRVDRGRSRESGGTGLGLALVKHVAERNGGSIEVDSAVGTGTSFSLLLPRAN